LNPFKLKAIVETPSAVNQIPITGHPPKKKCRLRQATVSDKRLDVTNDPCIALNNEDPNQAFTPEER